MLRLTRSLGDSRLTFCRYLACAGFLALAVAACSGNGPLGRDVIAQARPDGKVSFDVVDVNDTVLAAVLAHQPLPFDKRFAPYQPPPTVKIAAGDVVAVVIWEAGSNGLFGNSLTQLSLPAGAAAVLSSRQVSALPAATPVPSGLTPSLEEIGGLYGIGETEATAPETEATTPELGAAAEENPLAAAGSATAGESTFGLAEGALGAGVPGPGEAASMATTRRTGSFAGRSLAAPRTQQILAVARLSGSPGTIIPDQLVGPDGAISVPYAGRIHVAGRTPQQVAQMIEKRLDPMALDPQVMVSVEASAANSVAVAGDAVAGKRVALSPGGDRLLQVIAAAGGSRAAVRDTNVELSRDGVTASIPLAMLIADPVQDIFARPGDVLTLERRPQTFSVFGATGKNTAITFSRDRLSLAEALAEGGGLLDQQADPRAVFLFRYEPDALVRALGEPIATDAHDGLSPVVYRLNMKKAQAYLLARRFPVHDKDVIFASDAPTQQIYYFFQALQNITGPAVSTLVVCQYATC
jgi:polysaccharide biosynthesis/export protein